MTVDWSNMKTLVVILSVAALAACSPVNSDESVLRSVVGSFVNCNSDLGLCMKEYALKAADRLSAIRKLKIFDGITIINSNPKEARSLESLSEDPAVRNKQLTERLWESTSQILKSTELELSYSADKDEAESRALDDEVEGREKKKKKEIKKKLRMFIPLLVLAKAKAVAISIFALVVIAASIFKLAVIAKIAFIIKLIAIIKALLAKKHSEEDHGWQSQGWESAHVEHHPIPVEHGHGWDSGWSRSRNEANSMAYSGHF